MELASSIWGNYILICLMETGCWFNINMPSYTSKRIPILEVRQSYYIESEFGNFLGEQQVTPIMDVLYSGSGFLHYLYSLCWYPSPSDGK